MKIKRLLTVILTSAFLSGCGISAASSESRQNNDQTIENSRAKKQKNNFQNEMRANGNQKITGAPSKTIVNAVCPIPAKPCHHREKQFDEWELSFRMPARLKANTANASAPFWAIILKKYELQDCDGGEYLESVERERKRLQAVYQDHKVFADYQCPNMAAVSYNFAGKFNQTDENVVGNFVAIYAGETTETAEQLLKKLQAEYPEAEIKKMIAVYEKIVQ